MFSTSLEFGVLLVSDGVQLLDVAPADLCSCMTPWYMTACGLPEDVASKGINFNFHYISSSGNSLHPMTAGVQYHVTDTLDTCPPEKLDILMIGGPDPSYQPPPAVQEYLRKAVNCPSVTLLTVCTGVLPVLRTTKTADSSESVLSGHTVTAPRPLVKPLSVECPTVNFVEKRWWKDQKKPRKAQIWSSGGVANGMDMMQAFMREGGPKGEWPMEVVETTLVGLTDFAWRKQEYE